MAFPSVMKSSVCSRHIRLDEMTCDKMRQQEGEARQAENELDQIILDMERDALSASERQRGKPALTCRFACRSQVYKPPKTDRVQVNLDSRQYVIPDDKRRDEVRWAARVMMHS